MRKVTRLAGVAVATGAAVAAVLRGTDRDHPAGGERSIQNFSCDTLTMRIQFKRSGGFAGMTMTAAVDTDSLPDAEGRRVCQLVEDAAFFDLPARAGDSTSHADGFSYEITVESGARSHTVVAADGGVPERLVPLIQWLGRAARSARGGA